MESTTAERPFAPELEDLQTLIKRLKDRPSKSRELKISLTNLETAELWLEKAGKPQDE